LARAIADGKLPQVLMLVGPAGVGKQRLALWLAQRLICRKATDTEPCGRCRECGLVLGLRHPDVHWMVPIPRPKAGDPDKQVAEAEESIGEVLAERRTAPLYGPVDGMAAHGVASARLVLKRAGLTPVEAARKVFILGDADRLVSQESSPEAANALLKLLEEPPADTVIVLTVEEANRVLPTIRSRAVPLRLGRLADDDVRAFLEEALDSAPADLARRVREAEGCPGRALRVDADGDRAVRERAVGYLELVLGGDAAGRLEAALKQQAFAARGEFTAMLDAMAAALRDALRGADSVRPAGLRGRDHDRLLVALGAVLQARDTAQGNVNPQLLLASLGEELAETL